MIFGPNIFGEFGSQVWREHIYEVGIFDKNFYKSFFINQTNYLKFM